MRIQRLLFTTDFSECAERAFSHASHLAVRYESELHVLNVTSPHRPSEEDPLGLLDLEPESEGLFSDAADPEEVDDVVVIHSRMTAHSPVAGILDYAEHHEIDLIVMGTHGRVGIDHLLSGSVAEDVVRHAACPVLTVRCKDGAGWKDQVRRILVPVDFSEHTPVRTAIELAHAYGAEVDLLHVIEEAVLPTIYGVEPLSPGAPLYVQRTEGALRKTIADLPTGDLTVRSHVRIGNPTRRILEFAQEGGSDLIVLGSQGRTGLGKLLMGSVADKVVRLADVPVFTAKWRAGADRPSEAGREVAASE
jgi:nucleotide-binding universal stress UspA family protein